MSEPTPTRAMRSVMRGVCEDVLDGSLIEDSADPSEVLALVRQLADQYVRLLDAYEAEP